MKNIFTLLLLITIVQISLAQHFDNCDNNEKMEKIKAEKIAFITSKVNLSVDEAQKFWPLYNEMEAKHKEIKDNIHEIRKNLKRNLDELSDDNIEDLIDQQMNLFVKMIEVEKDYYEKFKTVLPIRKIFQLQQAEKEFTRELLKKLKGHHQGHPGPGPRPIDCIMD